MCGRVPVWSRMLSNAVECVPAPVQQKLVTYYSTSTIALHRSFPICSTPACFISLDRGQLQVNAGRSGLVPPRLFQTNAAICQRRILTVLRLKRATRQTRVFYRAYTLTCSCTSWLLSLHHQPSSICCLARILQEPASEASTLPAATHSLQHQLGAGKSKRLYIHGSIQYKNADSSQDRPKQICIRHLSSCNAPSRRPKSIDRDHPTYKIETSQAKPRASVSCRDVN